MGVSSEKLLQSTSEQDLVHSFTGGMKENRVRDGSQVSNLGDEETVKSIKKWKVFSL